MKDEEGVDERANALANARSMTEKHIHFVLLALGASIRACLPVSQVYDRP